MNTEMKVHEHNLAQFDARFGAHKEAYDAGKADAIKELVSTITDRLNKHNDLIGVNGIAHEKAVIQMLREYKKEVLGDEG